MVRPFDDRPLTVLLTTAHGAGRVAEPDLGLVTEPGTHADPVAAGGAYTRLRRTWRGA